MQVVMKEKFFFIIKRHTTGSIIYIVYIKWSCMQQWFLMKRKFLILRIIILYQLNGSIWILHVQDGNLWSYLKKYQDLGLGKFFRIIKCFWIFLTLIKIYERLKRFDENHKTFKVRSHPHLDSLFLYIYIIHWSDNSFNMCEKKQKKNNTKAVRKTFWALV